MFGSINSKILGVFLFFGAAVIAVEWAEEAAVPPDYVRVLTLTLVLVLAILCTLLGRSISGRLQRLRRVTEALTRNEILADIPDLGDDEIGDFARSIRAMAPEVRRLAEGLTTASAQREAILEGMIEGLLVVDHTMRVSFCNAAFARVIGGPGVPQQGTPMLSVVRDPALLALIKGVIQSGNAATARIQLSAAPVRSFQVRAAPLIQPAASGAVVLLLDITEMERLERMRKDFVANVSHELRTPLTAIRGYAETLLDGALNDVDNRRKFVEVILAHCDRLNNIATDLLILSDLESGHAQPAAILSIAECVDTAIQIAQTEASMRGVRLIRGDVLDLKVCGDRIRLEQVLINLLDNAVKFNHSGGTVRVDVRASEDGRTHVSIEDSGIGIPSDDIPRVFERFYRVDKGRSRAVGGTGLGLSIVKHAVEQMNGSVSLESKLGHGTRVTVTLPMASHNGG